MIALVAMAAGCGRIGFDARDADGGSGDAAADCWASWRAGMPALGTPRHIDELATDAIESNPSMGANKTILFFDRGPMDNRDLYFATRSLVDGAFGVATPFEPLNSGVDDTRVSVSADGLVAELSSIRNGNDYDLYEARRGVTSDSFGAPSTAALAAVDTGLNEVDPELTDDGQRLYFSEDKAGGGQQIEMAKRAAATIVFDAPTLALSAQAASVFDPTLSPDELVMVYTTDAGGSLDLRLTVRTSTQADFGLGAPLSTVNTADDEGDAELSPDGCELFFASNRTGNRDLWVAAVTP